MAVNLEIHCCGFQALRTTARKLCWKHVVGMLWAGGVRIGLLVLEGDNSNRKLTLTIHWKDTEAEAQMSS